MFSKACEYGIKAVTFVASQSLEGQRVALKEIAEAIDSPVAFTAKILQQLRKNHIIDSVKGAHGGYGISSTQLDQVTLSKIVYAIDGDAIYISCGLGLSSCNALKPCPVHDKFVSIRSELRKMLESTTFGK